MNGLESFLLRDRLARAGFAPSVFRYPSMHASLAEVTAALAKRLRTHAGPVHLIGHSLGGVVVLETLEHAADLPPGRIVLLGSPIRGSCSARSIAAWSFGPQLLGPLAVAELARERDRSWRLPRDIGVIAGCRSVGLGRLFAALPEPNDGTVCVDETRLPGATAHIVFEATHTGLLIHGKVAEAVGNFLGTGSFSPPAN